MYLCAKGIELTSIYGFDIGFCSDVVLMFCFSFFFLGRTNFIVLHFAVNNSLGIQLLPSIPSC